MALSGFTNDPNELMRLILERSECELVKEGVNKDVDAEATGGNTDVAAVAPRGRHDVAQSRATGGKLGVYGENYLAFSLTGNVCLNDNITSASQLLGVISENVENEFVDDFKYEFGLGAGCEWCEVVEAFEEDFKSGELDKDDPNIIEEYEAMKLLEMNGTELNAAVDLNKVYDLQEAYWKAIRENVKEANKALQDRDDRA